MRKIEAAVSAALSNKGDRVTVSWAPWNKVGSGFRSRSVWANKGTLPERLMELAYGLLSITTSSGQPYWVTVEVGSKTVFDGMGCSAA